MNDLAFVRAQPFSAVVIFQARSIHCGRFPIQLWGLRAIAKVLLKCLVSQCRPEDEGTGSIGSTGDEGATGRSPEIRLQRVLHIVLELGIRVTCIDKPNVRVGVAPWADR